MDERDDPVLRDREETQQASLYGLPLPEQEPLERGGSGDLLRDKLALSVSSWPAPDRKTREDYSLSDLPSGREILVSAACLER